MGATVACTGTTEGVAEAGAWVLSEGLTSDGGSEIRDSRFEIRAEGFEVEGAGFEVVAAGFELGDAGFEVGEVDSRPEIGALPVWDFESRISNGFPPPAGAGLAFGFASSASDTGSS